MVGSEFRVSVEDGREAVRRIQQSEVFRGARALRHLVKFLAEKSLLGEADQLKEYSIGVDACGKGEDYDPREDSTVRIQAGRLRQKLAEYYKGEGKDDPIVVVLPKGGFRIDFLPRNEPVAITEPSTEVVAPATEKPSPVVITKPGRWKVIALSLGALLGISLATLAWFVVDVRRDAGNQAALAHLWTPQMEQLWAPLLDPERPVVVAISTPLFVGIEGLGYYRTVRTNRWEEAVDDPGLKAMLRGLKNPEISPRHPYTGVADANAVFLLERLLALKKPDIFFSRNIDVTWRQLSDNNVLLIGSARFSGELLQSLPTRLRMTLDRDGLRVLDPQPGEKTLFADQANILQSASGTDDGEVYSLITHVAGPNGKGDVIAFSGNLNGGSLAAVEAFTNPDLGKVLVEKMRLPSGEIPRYYQIGLKVKFRGGVPTDTSYLMHRVLQSPAGMR